MTHTFDSKGAESIDDVNPQVDVAGTTTVNDIKGSATTVASSTKTYAQGTKMADATVLATFEADMKKAGDHTFSLKIRPISPPFCLGPLADRAIAPWEVLRCDLPSSRRGGWK